MYKRLLRNFSSSGPSKITSLTNKDSPPAIGYYSKATMINFGTVNLIFCSGSLGVDNKGNLVSNEIEDQTRQALENLKSILEYILFLIRNNNSSINHISKTTVFLTVKCELYRI